MTFQVAFWLSLATPSNSVLPGFLLAIKAALQWTADSLSGYTSGVDEEYALACDLIRPFFNLLRRARPHLLDPARSLLKFVMYIVPQKQAGLP